MHVCSKYISDQGVFYRPELAILCESAQLTIKLLQSLFFLLLAGKELISIKGQIAHPFEGPFACVNEVFV